MVLTQLESRPKVFSFLKKLAPFSVIELGVRYAADGNVIESSKTGSIIQATVRDTEETTHSVTLNVLSTQEIDAQCTCSTAEQMREQWCPHAVAALWRATDLEFFDERGGFAATEAVIRMNTSSPSDIAEVIDAVSSSSVEHHSTLPVAYKPEVSIDLDLTRDRLGVKVFFDGEVQLPTIFEGMGKLSFRALDNILLQLLDEHGSWDEQNQFWFINSSDDIEIVLGLVQEYHKVRIHPAAAAAEFSHELLDARLTIEWQELGAELRMSWIAPDGEIHPKEGELLGTGPYWTLIGETIYRLSPHAARIASVFPYGPHLRLPRSQVGPILGAIERHLYDPKYIEIINPDLQPKTKVKTPAPTIEIERRESTLEHFASQRDIELIATVEFDYPTPPENQNVVYLPDREKEAECIEHLKSLGFEAQSDKKKYLIGGDAALNLLHRSDDAFPVKWKVDGLSSIRKSVRFASLSVNIAMSSPQKTDLDDDFAVKTDWFDCHISLVQNNANIPLSTLFKSSWNQSDKWIRLDSGSFAKVPGGGMNQLKTTLGMLDPNFRLANTIKTRLSTAQAISFSRIEDEQFQITLDKRLTSLSKKLNDFDSIAAIKAGKNFTGKLRSYQEDGLSWLHFLHEFELSGILADEMGLGKTVQTLALIQYLKDARTKEKKLTKPVLVVAPTSLITNWSYEAKRFTPKLKVLLLHGPQRKALFSQMEEHDIIITSYALLRLDRYDLEKCKFGYVILDEAQNIKNHQAATTKAAKALKSDHRLALTGTPTENRPMELWSIMDFLMPGYLGSSDFFRTFIEKPILEAGTGVQITKFLKAKTRPFILRRIKEDVEKDLPPKVESNLFVAMTPSQRDLYNQILEEVRPRVFEAVKKKGVRGASISILAALLRLRQVCNHPNSIDSLKDVPGFDSGKFNLLKELVEEALDSGRKILLFCQFREMLAIIRRWLDEIQAKYCYLDGATTNRQNVVDEFNSDPNVRLFLISLKAGGTGLNLTAADTVIIYDPWWNPAVESQAVDRAHRIGQTKTVNVYRLVTETSVEQKIMGMKAKKSEIVDALINENGLSTLTLSKTELESLFSPFTTE